LKAQAAPDDTSAKAVEDRIWAQWSFGSDTANLLMTSRAAIDGQDLDLALKLLDSIITLSRITSKPGTGAPRSTT
jgi:hypothetical protein